MTVDYVKSRKGVHLGDRTTWISLTTRGPQGVERACHLPSGTHRGAWSSRILGAGIDHLLKRISEGVPPMTGRQVGQPVPALGRGRSLPEPSHVRFGDRAPGGKRY